MELMHVNDKSCTTSFCMDVASDMLDPHRTQRCRLVFLSDLRHVDHQYNFEKKIPDPSVFIQSSRDRFLLPDLSNIHVAAYGLHHQRGRNNPKFSAQQDENIRILWKMLFSEANASEVLIAGDY